MNIIYGTSRVTSGVINDKNLKNDNKNNIFHKIYGKMNLFEKIWYTAFFMLGIACLIVFPFSIELLITVLSLFIYMVGDNMLSRGIKYGFYITLTSSIVYLCICAMNRVWGEVLANALVYIPLIIVSMVKWNKNISNSEHKEVQIQNLSAKEWIIWLGITILGSVGLWALLQFALKQEYAYLNAGSIVLCIVGDLLLNRTKVEAWVYYAVSNVITIVMWLLISWGSWGTFPYVLSGLSALLNDFNGIYQWMKLKRINASTTGKYLASDRKRIKNVIRLRHKMQKFSWKAETDDNWQTRQAAFQKRYHTKATKTNEETK